MDVSIILPSLNPDEKLMCVVKGLVNKGFDDIILVNDGSDSEHISPFEEAASYPQCTVLTHDVNKGKGRALKTAFEYFLKNREGKLGVITVDGDNQHTPEDIYRCYEEMSKKPENIVLGVRDFSQSDVPKKSRYGNRITSFVFKVAVGIKISDTQTGLRAIPAKYLELMTGISGERFEYETNMLLAMKTELIPFSEVKIKTVYIEENKTSHFNPVKDSFRIYSLILKFLFSSLFSTLVDITLYTVFNAWLFASLPVQIGTALSVFIARAFSSVCNFGLNHAKVFKSKQSFKKTILKYYALCIPIMIASYSILLGLKVLLKPNKFFDTVLFAIVNTVLYFVSFKVQREWVFKNNQQDKRGKAECVNQKKKQKLSSDRQ